MGCCNPKAKDRQSDQLPGCWPCCSHPHGKRCNVVAGSLAIVAVLLSVFQALVFVTFGITYFYINPVAVELSLCSVAAGVGAIAMVVSFTATCRAYRPCGLKAIAALYAFCFVCQITSFILAVTNDQFCYSNSMWGPTYICRAWTNGFSITSSILWAVCSVVAAHVPSYDKCSERIVSPVGNEPAQTSIDEEKALKSVGSKTQLCLLD